MELPAVLEEPTAGRETAGIYPSQHLAVGGNCPKRPSSGERLILKKETQGQVRGSLNHKGLPLGSARTSPQRTSHLLRAPQGRCLKAGSQAASSP